MGVCLNPNGEALLLGEVAPLGEATGDETALGLPGLLLGEGDLLVGDGEKFIFSLLFGPFNGLTWGLKGLKGIFPRNFVRKIV